LLVEQFKVRQRFTLSLTVFTSALHRITTMRLSFATPLLCLTLGLLTPVETENAIANGDTRTLHLHHTHTGENIDATFRVNGQYDYAVLEKLNWFLRDWRRDESTKMDPRLFDVVWETYRESGSSEPIQIVSAYRSPQTNAMLRRRSKAVAEHSQHILGKAMDMHYVDVPMSRIREIGMRLQRGGVGYYPTAGSPFVHLDVGSVRAWPRMSYDQLVRLFPDGKTVHLPASGQPLARYEEARAEIESRGGSYTPTLSEVRSRGFFASLFGTSDDDEDGGSLRGRKQRLASLGTATGIGPSSVDDSSAAYFAAEAARRDGRVTALSRLGRANVNLPDTTPKVLVKPQPDMIAQAQPHIALANLQTDFTPDSGSDIPLPPKRPADLLASADFASAAANLPSAAASPPSAAANLPSAVMPDNVPLPPQRPDFMRLAMAKEPPRNERAPDTTATIAPAAVSTALRRQPLSPAKLDASNYRALTASLAFSQQNPTTSLAREIKRASRTEINRVLFGPALSTAQSFGPRENRQALGFTDPALFHIGPRQLASID
jgi:uncharacterized protein YcbK (DUF882 family)